jgi:hypothetical protein
LRRSTPHSRHGARRQHGARRPVGGKRALTRLGLGDGDAALPRKRRQRGTSEGVMHAAASDNQRRLGAGEGLRRLGQLGRSHKDAMSEPDSQTVDIRAWIDRARRDPLAYAERQATEIVLSGQK